MPTVSRLIERALMHTAIMFLLMCWIISIFFMKTVPSATEMEATTYYDSLTPRPEFIITADEGDGELTTEEYENEWLNPKLRL